MRINIKKLNEEATIPTRGSEYAAGYDLYACIPEASVSFAGGETMKINTGIAMEIPTGYVGLVFPRSGLATKRGLRLANCVGVIDSDYRGEIMVAVYNDSKEIQTLNHGDRIAQIAIMPHLSVEFEETNSLEDTKRGENGFGSTGTN